MKLKLLLFFIAGFFFVLFSKGSHVAGGEITYKYIGNNKFEIAFTLYRDCRGGAIISPNFKLIEVSTSVEVSLYPSLISIVDISTVCAKKGIKCDPVNKLISTTLPIFEEHIYKDTLDFDGNLSTLKKYCEFKLGMGECCRNGEMTSGGAGNDFWVTATLDICKAPANSSPVFLFKPNIVSSCNQPLNLNFGAKDIIDGDSLSYSFTEPLISWTAKVAWSGSRNFQSPLEDYWPPSYNKSKGPNPNLNPPIGTYLDPLNGQLIFTPTNCSEISKLSVKVTEWRKDSNGKYQEIGEVTRDIMSIVMSNGNNKPTFPINVTSYSICENQPFVLDIPSFDQGFIPAPPSKPIYDSVTIEWDNGVKGADFFVKDKKALQQTGRFVWTPPVGSIRTEPYQFIVKATDDYCPFPFSATKTFNIYVTKSLELERKFTKISENEFEIKVKTDTSYNGVITSQVLQILDSTGKTISISNYNWTIDYQSNGDGRSDTLLIRIPGRYIIVSKISANGYCGHYFVDTVIVKRGLELGFNNEPNCIGQASRVRAYPYNGVGPYKYYWKTSTGNKTDTLGYYDLIITDKPFNYYCKVIDGMGQVNSFSYYISPNSRKPGFTLGKDIDKCAENGVKLKARKLTNGNYSTPDPKQWVWTLDGKAVNFKDSFETTKPGIYIIKATDIYGCYFYDTLSVLLFPYTKLELKDGKYCQDKNILNQNEILSSPASLNSYTNVQWKLLKSLADITGNYNTSEKLMQDFDTSSAYYYKLLINKSKIDLRNSNKDSLLFSLIVSDSFNCKFFDTLSVTILKSPEIITVGNLTYCRNETIDLSNKISHNMPLKVSGINKPGYENWPKQGEISNLVFKPLYFSTSGKFFVDLSITNEMCQDIDSMVLNINQSPYPQVDPVLQGDSIIFIDNSLYATNRKWYIDGIYYSDSKKLTLKQSSTNKKQFKLKLTNENCADSIAFTYKPAILKMPEKEVVKISPNPVSKTLNIETGQTGLYKIELINALGQKVSVQERDSESADLDVSHLEKGIYILLLIRDNTISSIRFVKE